MSLFNKLVLFAPLLLLTIVVPLGFGSGGVGGITGKPAKTVIQPGDGALTPPSGGLTLNTPSLDPTASTSSTDNTSSQTLQPQPSALLDQPRTNRAAAREIISSRREARRAFWQMRNL